MAPPTASPTGKITRRFFSWDQIHATVLKSVDQLHTEFDPTLLVGISGGGLIPLRMLRSGFKLKIGKTIPIQVVGALHYNDDQGKVLEKVERTQWLSPDVQLSGARILLVDEVDDSRKTLSFIVDEMYRFFDEAKSRHNTDALGPWQEPKLGVYVIHNKVRPKEADIDSRVYPAHYWVGQDVPNAWHVYPWDAEDITAHTALAHAQEHYFREKPGELALALAACMGLPPEQAASAIKHYADGGSTAAPKLEALMHMMATSNSTSTNGVAHNGDVDAGAAAAGSSSNSGNRPRSALTSALLAGNLGAIAEQQSGGGGPAPADGVSQGPNDLLGWRSEPDGMYFNMGYVPPGLAPRFGSLTLVDDNSLSSRVAAQQQ